MCASEPARLCPPSLRPPAASALVGALGACLYTHSPARGVDADVGPAGAPLTRSRRTSLCGVCSLGVLALPAAHPQRGARLPAPPTQAHLVNLLRGADGPRGPCLCRSSRWRESATQTALVKGGSRGGSDSRVPRASLAASLGHVSQGPWRGVRGQRGRPPPCLVRLLGLDVGGKPVTPAERMVPGAVRALAPLQAT